MNSPIVIKNSRTETFYENLSGTNTFSENIYLDFIPDEIILKNISYYDDDGTTAVAAKTKLFVLKSTLVSDNSGNIATFPLASAYHEQYHIPFRNVRPIGGTYTFTLTDVDGAAPGGGGNFDLFIGITLTFVQYAK
eukprot:Lithocolla_globosa_v1_NODE_3407_length_1681_cov_654.876999.p3 type:complete len:136 gc:universal NODE_3407_length_1681_cov_654.876999:782-1189(+)